MPKHSERNKVALYWEGVDGTCQKYTFLEMKKLSDKCANMLRKVRGLKRETVYLYSCPPVAGALYQHDSDCKAWRHCRAYVFSLLDLMRYATVYKIAMQKY